MHGDEIRQARRDAKLSQDELARRAGVPRSQLVRLEQGENVTLETLKKVLAQLPHLKQITLVPGATAMTAGIDIDEIRTAARELHESSARLLRALGAPVPATAEPAGEGAAVHSSSWPHPTLIERLEKLIDELEAGSPAVGRADATGSFG